MGFELYMKELQFVEFRRGIACDGCAIDQQFRWHQHSIDQKTMSRRHVEIGMRDARRERGGSESNGKRVLHPRLRGIALLERIMSDPPYGTQSAEHCRKQIADREVLDFALAFGG